MRNKLALGLCVLCLVLVTVGLIVFAPLMAPIRECTPVQFWAAACDVDIAGEAEDEGELPHFGCTCPARDGYFICYYQGFHGQWPMRIEQEAALAALPAVVAALDQALDRDGPTTPALRGYEAWLEADPSRSDARLLLEKVREARDISLRERSVWDRRETLAETRQFDLRWAYVRRYWLNIALESVYLGGLVVFAFWPWVRRRPLWHKCAHMVLLPLLLMLPYYLGYATFTYTSAGPSGGVLYPWLIVWFRGAPCVWWWLTMALPKPLLAVSQPLGPMLSLSGGGGPGVVVCLLVGAVAALGVFSAAALIRRLCRGKRRAAGEADEAPEGVGAGEPGDTSPNGYRRGALGIVAVASAAFVAVLCLVLAGTITQWRFMYSTSCGRLGAMRWALAFRPGLVKAQDPDGRSALHVAAEERRGEALVLLLEEGADPHLRAADGRTPLHLAAEAGRADMVEALLLAGADARVKDECQETPLHLAGSADVAKLLLQYGAEVSAATPDGRTPLYYAANRWEPGVVQVLLAAGADPEVRDRWGRKPLHGAGPEVTELLLAAGADVNARTSSGRAPLHMAVESGHKEWVEVLIHAGADMNVLTPDGLRPLDLAREDWRQEVRDLLIESGAVEGTGAPTPSG